MRVSISLRLANEDWATASAYVVEAERLGVDCVWSAEAWGHDAVTPLVFVAQYGKQFCPRCNRYML